MNLEYQSQDSVEKPARASALGLLSFVAMGFFAPWAIAWFFIVWSHQGVVDSFPKPWGEAALWLPMMLPAFVAFIFGLISLRIDGSRSQGILGLLGLSSSALILVTFVMAAYFVER